MRQQSQVVEDFKAPSEMVPSEVGRLAGGFQASWPHLRNGYNNILCPGGKGLDLMSPLGSVPVLPTVTRNESQILVLGPLHGQVFSI